MEENFENKIPINQTETDDDQMPGDESTEASEARPADELLSWVALEPHFQNRSVDRQWTIGIVAGIIFVIALVLQNFLLGLLVAAAAFSLITLARQEPKELLYAVSKKGVRAGDRLYPYATVKSFWIRITDDKRELSIESDRFIAPMIELPIAEEVNLTNLRAILKKYLPEEKHEDSLINSISDYFGF